MSFFHDLVPHRDQPISPLERYMVGTGALYLGVGLGVVVTAPQLLELVVRVDELAWTDVGLARALGLAVAIIGFMYVVGGRTGGTAFALSTVVERAVVVVVLAALWFLGELPGLVTFLFCALNLSLLSGALWLWRVEARERSSGLGAAPDGHVERVIQRVA